jgi:thiamine biosynthesis lipoprotein ApbE
MKVTPEQFEEAIRKTGGLYTATVNYIKKKWKIEITRQSVKDRADKNPELLQEVREAAKDKAESVVFELMGSKNDTVKFKSATYYLDRLGTDRGYILTSKVDHTTKGESLNEQQFDFSQLSKEEKKQYKKLLLKMKTEEETED